jgi:hypothetical protein
MKRDALPDLHAENNAAWHTDLSQRKAAHEKALESRAEELHEAIHFHDERPRTYARLDCGCIWEAAGWERGRADSYGSFRWVAVNGRYTKECADHE